MDDAARPTPDADDDASLLEPLPYAGQMDGVPEAEGRTLDDAQDIPVGVLTTAPLGTSEGDRARTLESQGTLLGSPTQRLAGPRGESSPRRQAAPPRPQNDGEVSTRDLDDPTAVVAPPPQVIYITPTVEEGKTIREAVTKKNLSDLNHTITALHKEVAQKGRLSAAQAARILEWLNEARTIVLARPEHYPIAELRVQQTQVLLQQADYSNEQAARHTERLVSWNLLWLILFGALFALDSVLATTLVARGLATRPAGIPATELPSLVWYFQPWLCVMAGGIGGALAALITLAREVSRREYDPASNLDYRLNTLKGAVFGALTYYILLGGFITVAATTDIVTDASDLAHRVQGAGSMLFIVMAFLGGFAQPRLLALLPDVWSRVTGEEKEEPPAPQPTPVTVAPAPVEPVPPVGGTLPNNGVGNAPDAPVVEQGYPTEEEGSPVADPLPPADAGRAL